MYPPISILYKITPLLNIVLSKASDHVTHNTRGYAKTQVGWLLRLKGNLLLISPNHQFSSVAQLCPILCDPMDCSLPGFRVHHQLPELAQIQVHRVGDAIQPSHLLTSPSPPAFNFPTVRVFSSESVLCIRWPKYQSFSISPSNEYSGLISWNQSTNHAYI